MELTEDEIIEKNGKHCGHCNRNTLPPYEMNLLASHVVTT